MLHGSEMALDRVQINLNGVQIEPREYIALLTKLGIRSEVKIFR